MRKIVKQLAAAFLLLVNLNIHAIAQQTSPPTGEFPLITTTIGGSGSPLLSGEGIQIAEQVLVDRFAIYEMRNSYNFLEQYVIGKYGQAQQVLINNTTRDNVRVSIEYSNNMANVLLYELRRIVDASTYSALRAKINAKHNEYKAMLKPLIKTPSSGGSTGGAGASSGGGGGASSGSDQNGGNGGKPGTGGYGWWAGGGMYPDPSVAKLVFNSGAVYTNGIVSKKGLMP